ncbi:uncharacterized protein A1O5_05385 [Cladophialophora psammophila CBS 110553]|uniref:UDP-N-acetylglucosamine transferase subunit ALG14 n=1 Tax=Cladophialophora psammophila CBS 110553 TaxID=1182543 RepID=W9WTP2_9EURO|nr:uncharacterized protein A1O5_05385 [Cladophialophora psammophila CBS 110553]EXJ71577.1 hypothetical protein A1O5_05385 [Cladophialophora psammophila CBS 110553]
MNTHQAQQRQHQRGPFPGGATIWMTMLTPLITLSPTRQPLLFILAVALILLSLSLFRLVRVLRREPISCRPPPSPKNPTHLLVVLGSGGHTAEILNILSQYHRLQHDFTTRTYVVSSGDDFSAFKAKEFEAEMLSNLKKSSPSSILEDAASKYSVVTVRRARRVHQSLLTAPITSLQCLWDCLAVLRGTHRDFQPQSDRKTPPPYPDLIVTNGPGTGVIVFLASIILLFFGFSGPSAAGSGEKFAQSGQMRTIFIESWARVRTLSLSGRLLNPFVDRFLVQWPQLSVGEGKGRGAEFVGSLVT